MDATIIALYERLVKHDDALAARDLQELAVVNKNPAAAMALSRWHAQRSRLEESLKYIETAALTGDSFAQAWLADCYYQGVGTTPDYALAKAWAEKSFSQHNEYGARVLAEIHFHGSGIQADRVRAFELIKWACSTGSLAALYTFGRLLIKDGRLKDGITALSKAAEQGEVYSCGQMGARYYWGEGVPKDIKKAIPLLEVAAAGGCSEALYVLARYYESTDCTKALGLLTASAAQNHFEANRALAAHLILGSLGVKDNKLAQICIERAKARPAEVICMADSESIDALLEKAIAHLTARSKE